MTKRQVAKQAEISGLAEVHDDIFFNKDDYIQWLWEELDSHQTFPKELRRCHSERRTGPATVYGMANALFVMYFVMLVVPMSVY
eukprot:gene3488-1819_t